MNTKPVPMPGNLLNVILAQLCAKPDKESPLRPVHSIAIGPNGIAATDSRQALIVGDLDDIHTPTDRKSALLEASRAKIYADTCQFENIDRLIDEATGEPKEFPKVSAILEKLNFMVHVADFDPELLKKAAQVAVAAGADRISLYHMPSGDDHSLLGLAFRYSIDVDQLEFNFDDVEQSDRDALYRDIVCKGVIASLDKKSRVDNETKVHNTAEEAYQKAYDELTENGTININGIDITDVADLKKHIEAMFAKPKPVEDDELFFKAMAFATEVGEVSTAILQRRFTIGFQTAADLLARMEEWGLIGPRTGPKPRKVLVTTEELKDLVEKGQRISALYCELVEEKLAKDESVTVAAIMRKLSVDKESGKILFDKLEKDGLLHKDGFGNRTFKGAK